MEVLHEGRWLPGLLLHAYRRDDGRWRGIVRYTAGVGERYEQGRDQDDIRRTPGPSGEPCGSPGYQRWWTRDTMEESQPTPKANGRPECGSSAVGAGAVLTGD